MSAKGGEQPLGDAGQRQSAPDLRTVFDRRVHRVGAPRTRGWAALVEVPPLNGEHAGPRARLLGR